jgi:hypothetical protein
MTSADDDEYDTPSFVRVEKRTWFRRFSDEAKALVPQGRRRDQMERRQSFIMVFKLFDGSESAISMADESRGIFFGILCS